MQHKRPGRYRCLAATEKAAEQFRVRQDTRFTEDGMGGQKTESEG